MSPLAQSWSSWTQPAAALASPSFYLAIPVVLILLRVAYAQAKRLLPSRSSKHRQMTYTVKWGRERLFFSLPPPDAKLAVIRNELADYTQLPSHSFKLVHAGAVMKDDNAPISSYGINEKSTIALIGTGEKLVPSSKIPSSSPASQAKPAPRTEEATITQIRTEMEKVRSKLLPDVDTFLASLVASLPSYVSSTTATSTAQPVSAARQQQRGKKQQPQQEKTDAKSTPHTELEQEHVRLGELLLQSLLRLDAIHSEGEWEQARKERKGAVKEVQALLDRLDGGWRARAKV